MDQLIPRKEVENHLLPIIQNGKDIWIIHRVKELPIEIMNMAINLAGLDFIKYIKLTDKEIVASSEVKGTKVKNPITAMNHPSAIGITILFDFKYKFIDFYEINSPRKGNGSKMVEAVFTDFPKDWQAVVVMDWSDGFWEKMKKKYKNIDWMY